MATVPKVDVGVDCEEKYGFFVPEDYIFKAKRGLNPEIVKEISWMKKEPEWMTKLRLRSLEIFRKKPMPTWGADLSVIDFENIFYYLKASDKQSTSWEDLPPDIKKTYDRLGVPEAVVRLLDVGRQVLPRCRLLVRCLQVIKDVLEVDHREVCTPGGHRLLAEDLERAEAKLRHPLGLLLHPRDLLDDLRVQAPLCLEDVVLGHEEAVLLLAIDP